MNTTQHTPGPWAVKVDGLSYRVHSDSLVEVWSVNRFGAGHWARVPITNDARRAAIAKATGSAS